MTINNVMPWTCTGMMTMSGEIILELLPLVALPSFPDGDEADDDEDDDDDQDEDEDEDDEKVDVPTKKKKRSQFQKENSGHFYPENALGGFSRAS